MLNYLEAKARVEERGVARRQQRFADQQDMPLFSAQGHVLAADLISPEAVPAFDNSAMDGYAVCAADVSGASEETPVNLPILGLLAAGDEPVAVKTAGALEIMTGAPMPAGSFDAVIRVEDTMKAGEGSRVLIRKAPQAGDNIRRRGSDFAIDQVVARAGQTVTPELMMSAASLGLDMLPVQAPVRVALLVTGRELGRFSDKDLQPGMIRDASGPFLQATLNRPDFDLIAHKMLIDDPVLFRAEALKILELQPDIIISTGAVSMGKFDFVKDALLEMGADLHFHKVAMRPGKPILFAEWKQGPVWFGLPGNPVSTVVGWRFFIDPYVRALRGQAPETTFRARLAQPYKKPPGLTCFLKANVHFNEAGAAVRIHEGQGSYMLSPLLEANCWAALQDDGDEATIHSLQALQ